MQSLSSPKLNTWFQSLSDPQKRQISTIDSSEIMSDLANVANNALLVCKLHPDCKDKDLIVWKKAKADNEGIVTHTFTLNLFEKSVLGKHLDDLFSSFSVFITRQVGRGVGSRGVKQLESGPKSSFNVKPERLSDLVQLISNAISAQFIEKLNEILLQKDQTPFQLYSSLVDFSSQNLFSDLSIPSYLKKLFDRFASCTFLIAQKIHFSYCEANGLDPLAPQINEKVNQFFSMLSGLETADNHKHGLVFAKTVSQIEKERAQEENSEDQSTDNGNDSPKGSQGEVSGNHFKEEMKFGIPADSSRTVRSVPLAETYMLYEGCFLGDLEMMFDPSDCFTIDEVDPLQNYSNFVQEEQENNENQEEENYEEIEQDQGQYYPQMGYMQPVYGYYPEYYQPAAYAGGYNMEGYYQGSGYDNQQHLRKKSFESQSSYGSDKENFSSQYGNGEFSYYKKKAQFDTRSKLPPRFQRKREGNFRV